MITNKIKKRLLAIGLCVCLCSGCGVNNTDSADESSSENAAEDTAENTAENSQKTASSASVTEKSTQEIEEQYETVSAAISEIDYEKKKYLTEQPADCQITMQEQEVEVEGEGAVFKDGVLTITAKGTYELSGTLTDGCIVIDAGEENVNLNLNGLTVANSEGPAIWVKNADEVVVFLVEGSENSLLDGSEYYKEEDTTAAAEEEEDAEEEDLASACVYSTADLTFAGTGSLKIAGNCEDAVKGKDDVKFIDGTYQITAADDAIVGKDSVAIHAGTFTIQAQGDAVKSTKTDDSGKGYVVLEGGSLDITAVDDGLQAENAVWINAGDIQVEAQDDAIHSEGSVTVRGGSLVLDAGDDGIHGEQSVLIADGKIEVLKSYEGCEAAVITFEGGESSFISEDDGINAGTTLTINDGTLAVDAGGDGLDSNGTIAINGGTTTIDGPTNSGNGALDYDGQCVMNGGILIAAGSSGMLQSIDPSSSQAGMAVVFDTVQQAGTTIEVKDSSGNVIVTYTPAKNYGAVVIAAPQLTVGESYEIDCAGSLFANVTLTSQSVMVSSSGSSDYTQSTGGGRGGMGGNAAGGQMKGGMENGRGTDQTGSGRGQMQ